MATLRYSPREQTLERGDSIGSDEKHNEKQDGVDIVTDAPGEVFDDLRNIDMGEDGKERPIGMASYIDPCYAV